MATSDTRQVVLRELTPRGRGGVTVLELRGPNALARIARLAPSLDRKPMAALATSVLVRLRDGGEDLDEALVWLRADDACELHVHGSPVLVERIRELLLSEGDGCPGGLAPESLEQRAERALAHAPSAAAARMLLDQIGGAMSRALAELATAGEELRGARLAELAEAGRVAAYLITPPRLVLAGPVNAGKSSLLNTLLGQERVVVSNEEGTTRDAVRARGRIGAYAVDLVDTAGDREAQGKAAHVERMGQEQGRSEAGAADLVLWLQPSDAVQVDAPKELRGGRAPVVVLNTKSDLVQALPTGSPIYGISALENPLGAKEQVERRLCEALALPLQPWAPGAAVPFDALLRGAIGDLQAARGETAFLAVLSTLESGH
jgi:small GTP-binding protein